MRFIYKVLVLLAAQAFALLVHAGTVEIDNKGANTTVVAVIAPSADKIGKPVNIWISAVYNGVAYFYNGKSWVPYTGGPLPVASRGVLLSALNKLMLAQGTDLNFLPEADLYVGYGTTEQEMETTAGTLTKVITIERKMRWPAPPAQ